MRNTGKVQKDLKNEFLRAKCTYENNLFNGKSTDCKKFYDYIRSQTTVCSTIPCMKSSDGTLATTATENA